MSRYFSDGSITCSFTNECVDFFTGLPVFLTIILTLFFRFNHSRVVKYHTNLIEFDFNVTGGGSRQLSGMRRNRRSKYGAAVPHGA
jgi:hypothetical protein